MHTVREQAADYLHWGFGKELLPLAAAGPHLQADSHSPGTVAELPAKEVIHSVRRQNHGQHQHCLASPLTVFPSST